MTSEQALARADLIKRMENWRKKRDRLEAELTAERDALIREGKTDGMANTETAEHMTINRGTVIRVLGAEDESED